MFNDVIGKQLDIISEIVGWYETNFHIVCIVRKSQIDMYVLFI